MDTVTQKLGQTLKNGQFRLFWPILAVFDTFSSMEKKVHTKHTSPSYISELKQFSITCVADIVIGNCKHGQMGGLKFSVFSMFCRLFGIAEKELILGVLKHRESIFWVILS